MLKFKVVYNTKTHRNNEKIVLSPFWSTEIQTNLRKKKFYFFVVYQKKLAEKAFDINNKNAFSERF